MDLSYLTQFIDSGKLGGWTRAAVGALIAAAIAKWPTLSLILDPATQAALGVAASGIVIGLWSHLAKVEAAKNAPAPVRPPSPVPMPAASTPPAATS